jgi:hypothetical protein
MSTKNNNRPSNYFIATVRSFRKEEDNGGVALTKGGQPIAKCRASLSMGKNQADEYKPSMWLELIGYTPEGDTPNEVTEAVGALQNGEYVTVKGRLAMDEWTGEDGATRQSHAVLIQSIEPFSFDNDEDEGEEEEAEADLI